MHLSAVYQLNQCHLCADITAATRAQLRSVHYSGYANRFECISKVVRIGFERIKIYWNVVVTVLHDYCKNIVTVNLFKNRIIIIYLRGLAACKSARIAIILRL